MATPNERQEVNRLADALFLKIQASQGHFFFSDGEYFDTKAEFFERVRGRLKHGRKAVRIMEQFLRQHGEK